MSSRQERIDEAIYNLLVNIAEPANGLSNLNLTQRIHPDWESYSNIRFRAESKYIERRLGAIRQRIDEEIARQIQADPDADRRAFQPRFLPYALPVRGVEATGNDRPQFWLYFNAATRLQYIRMVITSLMQKSEGLERKAQLLQEVFQPEPDYGRG